MTTLDEQKMVGRLVAPEIGELLAGGETRQARAALCDLMSPEIADVLADLDDIQRPVAFRLLPTDLQAEVFVLLENEQQEQLLRSLATEHLVRVFNDMEPDDRVELFEEMPGRLVSKLLALMAPEERRQTQRILGYPDESVGRVMTPEYVALRGEWTAKQALKHIRKNVDRAETVDLMYVVDDQGRLIDDVTLQDLVFADPSANVASLVDGNVPHLNAHNDQEAAVHAMARYDAPVLPVVDRDNVLVGIVTHDDVADVAEEEVTEDMHKMGGMAALEEPYRATGVMDLFLKRGIWLVILFCGSLLTVTAMGFFEDALRQFIILSLFIPLVIASGGNSGSQAATLMIRSIALGEVRPHEWALVLRKELVSGLLLGSLLGLLGLVVGTIVAWIFASADAPTLANAALYGFAIGTALVGVVLIGTLTGSMLPLVMERIGIDPATSSTPFVATLSDVTGLVIYFATARLILGAALPG